MKKSFCLLLCLLPLTLNSLAQKQGRARIDSLLGQLESATDDTNKVMLLNGLSFSFKDVDPETGISYAKSELVLANKLHWQKGVAMANSNLSLNCKAKSDYPNALEYSFKALSINEALDDKPGIAANLGNIGLIYQNRGDYKKALEYQLKALAINEALKSDKGIALNLGNISTLYELQDNYDKALEYLQKALAMNRASANAMGVAINLGNIGSLLNSQKKYAQALAYYFGSLRIEESIGDKSDMAVTIGNIGETYFFIAQYSVGKIKQDSLVPASRDANLRKGIFYLEKSIDSCKALGLLRGTIKFSKSLSKAYTLSGNYKAALQAYMQYANTKDSVFSTENNRKLKQIENLRDATIKEIDIKLKTREIQLAQLAIDKKRNERVYFFLGIAGLVLVIIFIGRERKKSDKLLLNILPSAIADRLKKKEHPIADHFKNASIMFIDMAGFTRFAQDRDPKETVSILNDVFTHFDSLAEKHGLEKIKTIGDCYMAVAGIPDQRADHAVATVNMAMEIKNTMRGYKALDGTPIRFRIGLDCGAVVAGVIGEKKFIYDLWGDAVNTASRMEMTGQEDEIHCTDNFKTEFESCPNDKGQVVAFVSRGMIEVKSKGSMKTWFIS